jgi:hypothetical protein
MKDCAVIITPAEPWLLPTRETEAVCGNLHSRSVPQNAAWQRAQHQRCCITKPRVERHKTPLNPGNTMRFQTTLKELRPAATHAGLISQPFPTRGRPQKARPTLGSDTLPRRGRMQMAIKVGIWPQCHVCPGVRAQPGDLQTD